MTTTTLESAWRRQREWSDTASGFKASLSRWRVVVLLLAVAAAAFGTWSGLVAPESSLHLWTSVLAAVSAAVSPVIMQMRLGHGNVENWIRARSASEAFKAEVFKYRTGVEEYGRGDRTTALSEAMARIEESVRGIVSIPREAVALEADRLDDLSIDEYVERRVKAQVKGYYRPNARHHARVADRYRRAHLVLMLAGAAMGAVSALEAAGLGPWIAVVTTVTSSLFAHAAAGRHDFLAISYRATANRLEEIIHPWMDAPTKATPTPEERERLVLECENVISIENQSWHAKFGSASSERGPSRPV